MTKAQGAERPGVLTVEAAAALAGMQGSNIGQVVPASVSAGVRTQLKNLGLIERQCGLTIKGAAVACILQSQYLERMFG